MASEIPTHMLNLKNSFIPSLKFSLCALVTCGLSYVTKIFTLSLQVYGGLISFHTLLGEDENIFHIIGVFSNMNCINSLTSLHIVCCVNKVIFIKELFCK
jgi:hypothetical protein